MPAQTTILYHADCLDGFGAAYAAWRRFGDAARYQPMHHGESWRNQDLAGHNVFILDFSFPADDLLAMARVARSVCLLDHHVTALDPWREKLRGDADTGLSIFRHPELPLTLAFNLEKSGARLAWEHFHPGQPIPLALAHIEDQDIWRFRLPGTRPFCRALRLNPFDFGAWDGLVGAAGSDQSDVYRKMVAEGEAIERFLALEVERLANGRLAMAVILKGEPIDPLQALRHGLPVIEADGQAWRAVRGLAVNASAVFASELGNRLAELSGSFGLIWQLSGDGEVKISIRAQGNVDVAKLAENYGGGGHANAAGFRMSWRQFGAEVLNSAADRRG